jgi:hypothetical protein
MNTKKMMGSVDMEARLANAFQPVQPSRTFVQTVRGRIEHLTPTVVVVDRLNDSPRVLVVVSAVISGALLLAAVARALFYIVNKSKM